VIQAFESGVLDLKDFYFTGDDYWYRFELKAKRRFIEVLRGQFNSGVKYKGRALNWDTVVQEKTNELARYLTGRSRGLDFCEPAAILERTDSRTVRKAILSLTKSEASKRGIGKSTLHYLRANASDERAFRVYPKVRRRLKIIDNTVNTE
jgi:hypothetical protein